MVLVRILGEVDAAAHARFRAGHAWRICAVGRDVGGDISAIGVITGRGDAGD